MDGRKLFGAISVAIALFFFWPTVVGTWQEVSALRASVAERESLLTKRTEVLANIQTMYDEYQAKLSDEDGQKFAALVPVRKDTAEIITAIQDISGSTGMTVTEISMSEAKGKDAGQYRTLLMTLTMNGSYASLRSFLSSLEQYVRLLNVGSIDASMDARSAGSLNFKINAEAYFLK